MRHTHVETSGTEDLYNHHCRSLLSPQTISINTTEYQKISEDFPPGFVEIVWYKCTSDRLQHKHITYPVAAIIDMETN